MSDVIIIGGGPAGASAAIYAARGELDVTLINKRGGALLKAHRIDNYYGFQHGVDGASLYDEGLAQAARLGVKIVEGEVTSISYGDDGKSFNVQSNFGAYTATAIVLACGATRTSLSIPGMSQYEGKGVSSCAICDGFFYRGKEVAVVGSGEYALEEAAVLAPLAKKITLLTNGKDALQTDFSVLTAKIAEVYGSNGRLSGVSFVDKQSLSVEGIFLALGVAGSTALATKLGVLTDKGYVVTDATGRTNVPNVFAVGDCAGGFKQIATAVYTGAVAGVELVKILK